MTSIENKNYKMIIHATLSLIAQDGIKNVSAAKVANLIGISKSNVFHYFKTVDELLLKTLEEIMMLLVDSLDNNQTNSIEEALFALEASLFHRDEQTFMIEKAFWAFYCESIFNDDYKKIFCEYLAIAGKQLTELFSMHCSQKEAHDLSRMIIALLDGMSLHIAITGDYDGYYSSWKIVKDTILFKLKE